MQKVASAGSGRDQSERSRAETPQRLPGFAGALSGRPSSRRWLLEVSGAVQESSDVGSWPERGDRRGIEAGGTLCGASILDSLQDQDNRHRPEIPVELQES